VSAEILRPMCLEALKMRLRIVALGPHDTGTAVRIQPYSTPTALQLEDLPLYLPVYGLGRCVTV
jgi:hypothetical protein